MGLLGAFLLGTLAAVAVLYVHATRPLYYEVDAPLVQRATTAAATHFQTTEEEIQRITFPMTMHLDGQTCIELRPKRDDVGGYQACYRRGSGEAIYERVMGSPLGPRRLFPPLW